MKALELSRPRSLTAVSSARPTCYNCLRPISHCVCNLVSPFYAHCNILILQHPHERKKYHSTSKIILNAVHNSKRLNGINFEEKHIEEALAGKTPYLLYPSPSAVDGKSVVLDTNTSLVVVDGTWDEAQKIVHRNPLLRRFPSLSFSQPLRSAYHIRKQPKDYCLSTLESIAHVLKINAIEQANHSAVSAYDSLLVGFQLMVERQLPYLGYRNPHSRKLESSRAHT